MVIKLKYDVNRSVVRFCCVGMDFRGGQSARVKRTPFVMFAIDTAMLALVKCVTSSLCGEANRAELSVSPCLALPGVCC